MHKFKIFLVILIGVFMLAACGGETEETPTPAMESESTESTEAEVPEESTTAEEKTISFLSGQDENTGYTKIILDLTNEYIADHPNVSIDFEYYSQTDLQGRTQQLAAAGALPTLFPNPANETLDQMFENGQKNKYFV